MANQKHPAETIEKHWGELIAAICDEAKDRFKACECESDFCIQNVGFETIVFGGVNRLVWHVKHGWLISESDCTDRFISVYRRRFGMH